MRIYDVFINRRIADKIWEEHGVSADEAVDLLYSDPICPHDGHPMTSQQHTYTLAGDRFVVTYEAWVCSECGEVFLDRQQARRYGAIQMLDRLLKERNGSPQGQVLFDGEDLFVNLSLARDMAALWRQATSAMGR